MVGVDEEVLDEFGDLFLVGAGLVEVTGIFQDSFSEVPGGENMVEGREITFSCRESALPGTLEFRVTPFVSEIYGSFVYLRKEPDESGLTRVLLGIG
jgi:hypothetical protein